MNILLITGPYPPEIRAVSFMMQELAEELFLRGHDVTVATCWPQYNLSAEAKQAMFGAFRVENGVKVIRVKTLPVHKSGFLIRGLAYISAPYLFAKKIKEIVKQKIDAVIVYSPPLPLAIAGAHIKKKYGSRYLLNIQDIFPQNAIDIGIMKNKMVINFFEWMEKKAYSSADRLTSHTKNSRLFLIEKKGIPGEKIGLVPNWIDMDISRNARDTGAFREKYGLKGRFIFLFSGMIGPAQGAEFIINAAEKLSGTPQICFLFVGDGAERPGLEKMAEARCLKNVQFRPFMPREEYLSLVKEVDMGLACLNIKNKTPVIPGKILSFMACSIPILAFLNKESDAHELIREAQCGYSMLSDDPEKAAELIRRIYREKNSLVSYGQSGYNYAVNHFSKKVCIDKIEELLLV